MFLVTLYFLERRTDPLPCVSHYYRISLGEELQAPRAVFNRRGKKFFATEHYRTITFIILFGLGREGTSTSNLFCSFCHVTVVLHLVNYAVTVIWFSVQNVGQYRCEFLFFRFYPFFGW